MIWGLRLLAVYLLLLLCGCGVLFTDNFSKPEKATAADATLLRGSGWADWKYGYALPDVYQVETDEFIVAAQIANHSRSLWAAGPLLPVIPTFGLLKEGYRGQVSDTEEGVKVLVALYGKTDSRLNFDPCQITLGREQESISPTRFTTTFENAGHTSTCAGATGSGKVTIAGRANDIFLVELFYPQPVFPDNRLTIRLPAIESGGHSVPATTLNFDKGRRTYCNSIL